MLLGEIPATWFEHGAHRDPRSKTRRITQRKSWWEGRPRIGDKQGSTMGGDTFVSSRLYIALYNK